MVPVTDFSANINAVTTGGIINLLICQHKTQSHGNGHLTGGTPSTSTEKNPVITYNGAGEHSV